MHVPEANELVRTVNDEYGIATGRADRWEEHYEVDLGGRTAFLHYEDIREVDQ